MPFLHKGLRHEFAEVGLVIHDKNSHSANGTGVARTWRSDSVQGSFRQQCDDPFMTLRVLVVLALVAATPGLEDVPPSLRARAASLVAPGQIEAVEVERTDAGVVLYEFRAHVGGRAVEVKLRPDAGVAGEEREVPLREAPPALRSRISASLPRGARIERLERVIDDGIESWEAVVVGSGSRVEYVWSSDGGFSMAPATE